MFHSSAARWILGVAVFIAVLGLLRYKPWLREGSSTDGGPNRGPRERLTVGYLPVT
jgi:hypothetical protein